MNKIIKYQHKYNPGDKVYAIDLYNIENSKDSEEYKNYSRIFKVNIESVVIDKSGVKYWVNTTSTELIDEWGDCIPDIQVNKDKQILINHLLKLWKV